MTTVLAFPSAYIVGRSVYVGDRPNVPNVAIIVTDGQSNNPPLTAIEARKARAKGITILALGVGRGIGKAELNEMATDPDSSHVYTADNFDALSSLQALLSNKACEGTSHFMSKVRKAERLGDLNIN